LDCAFQKVGSLPKLALALGASSFAQIERWRIGLEPTPDAIFLRAVDLLTEADHQLLRTPGGNAQTGEG
jgi:hypothetical protein